MSASRGRSVGSDGVCAAQNMVVSVRAAAGTSSASMKAMSGAARRRERSPAAECADSRSSRSSSVDLKARTTRSCNTHSSSVPPRPARPASRSHLPPVPTTDTDLECGVDVLCSTLELVCIQSSDTSAEGTKGRLRRGYDMQLERPRG